jgi:hypothetical protein
VTRADRIAALAASATRIVVLGDKLSKLRVPVPLLVELLAIRVAVDAVREDIEREGDPKP